MPHTYIYHFCAQLTINILGMNSYIKTWDGIITTDYRICDGDTLNKFKEEVAEGKGPLITFVSLSLI
ncbi:MAG: hypothetical protein COA78_31410 [Blastopirellula sp.]|nr:MAG: hypothetical protein COA78_31410 [Blastopirellula sp.]